MLPLLSESVLLFLKSVFMQFPFLVYRAPEADQAEENGDYGVGQ